MAQTLQTILIYALPVLFFHHQSTRPPTAMLPATLATTPASVFGAHHAQSA